MYHAYHVTYRTDYISYHVLLLAYQDDHFFLKILYFPHISNLLGYIVDDIFSDLTGGTLTSFQQFCYGLTAQNLLEKIISNLI